MGTYWYMACMCCKEMVFIGKLSEYSNFNEDLFVFLNKHSEAYPFNNSKHKLLCVSDVGNSEVIEQTDKGWITEFKLFDKALQ